MHTEGAIPSLHFTGAGKLHEPPVLSEENQPCNLWATDHGKLNMHVDVRYHIFRKASMSLVATLEYCPSTEMIADMLRKPLLLQKFFPLRKLMPSMTYFPFAENN